MTTTTKQLEETRSARGQIAVLIVDDHPMVRAGLTRMLVSRGVDIVAEASTGSEAIEIRRATEPDLVLMDVQMPDMDGLSATEIIKAESPTTSVIMISGNTSREDLMRALEVGASGYLPKTATADTLVDAINLVRSGGSFVDSQLLRDVLQELGLRKTSPQSEREPALEILSPREHEVLCLLAEGLTNKEIGQQMHYSVGYIKNIVQRIIEKLGVSDRTQAAVYAVRSGLTPT